MAMSLCVRALRLTRAARPLLLRRPAALTRSVHTAPQQPAASSSVTAEHQHTGGPEEEHEEEVNNMFLKNPDSFGFSDDPEADLWNARFAFFTSVTLCLVLGTAFVYYIPDPRMNRWARKEAERLVKLREAQGLPLMPENYYDPDSLVLPDDVDDEE
ncbi:NADH dehydrogenase [ubiquinone] 1 beta subcomplex subunit 11, mitochondrial-like [Rana temporaria]|uniref:NADH dehydrogenase [ubiquinone] 1 beta subcomplex subunit 11, mitochondrial-like n=1 Tax=Rana temporaria TaxID=8407 RepID=UPI001AAD1A10|nr:NADH dehydrogenase [ubiquinone] 1 beta subcomplex subunit 11, mitochondrial-like [Rana temporaria]